MAFGSSSAGFYRFPLDFARTLAGIWSPAQLIVSIQNQSFSGSAYILWFFTVAFAAAIVILAIRQKRPVPEASRLLIASLISFLSWIAIMFLPNGALIHQGAYFSNIALIISAAWIVWGASRVMFWLSLGGNLLVSLLLYAPPPEKFTQETTYWVGAGVALLAFSAAARTGARAAELPYSSKSFK